MCIAWCALLPRGFLRATSRWIFELFFRVLRFGSRFFVDFSCVQCIFIILTVFPLLWFKLFLTNKRLYKLIWDLLHNLSLIWSLGTYFIVSESVFPDQIQVPDKVDIPFVFILIQISLQSLQVHRFADDIFVIITLVLDNIKRIFKPDGI